MTPEERHLITTLIDRLRNITGQSKDPEADRLIRQAMGNVPDAPYYLVQTVLIQEITLKQAEAYIAELQERLAAATTPQAAPTSFLGGLFERTHRTPPSGAVPRTGSRDYGAGPPQVSPDSRQYSEPAYGQPAYGHPSDASGPGTPAAASGGGFLRSAAATAAGLAGGALIAQGISSMFGSGSTNSPFSGMRMTPGSEAGTNRGDAGYGDYGGGGDYGGSGDYSGGGDYGDGGDYSDSSDSEDYGGGDFDPRDDSGEDPSC